MATSPIPVADSPALPDYLPARMVNELVYCPRLFFYEWVEGVFRESADTVEGKAQHKRVDRETKGMPEAEQLGEGELQTRSVTLSSERLRVIAKMDLIEIQDGAVTPVDYKHGKPREKDNRLELWPTDRVQLTVQGLILRENGYRCDEGVIFYASTKQRVRVAFGEAEIAEAENAIRDAWQTGRAGVLPPPLVDSPKCVGCSLAPICLPDEMNRLETERDEPPSDQLLLFTAEEGEAPKKSAARETRRLMTPRDDLRPVYLNTQGLRVGKSGAVLQVKEKDAVVQEIRLNEICQLNLMGNIQVSTQAVQVLCEAEIPVSYFSMGGWFYGITTGLSTKNVFLRKRQFALAEERWFSKRLARELVAGKIRNQRTFLLRNHIEPSAITMSELKDMAARADECESMETLLGLEGNAARLYFGAFSGLLKTETDEALPPMFRFDFVGRNRRPPRDAVNALLSLGYSMLAKDLTIACYAVGFDPMLGFYHQPRFGRPALALDLMEPFRPLIVDSAVVTAINTKMVSERDFICAGGGVALKNEGRKAFYRAYELRMDTLVTHPIFGYRVSYR
ncbi:MAG: CRISPR-associated endonuclease Cas1, partial [Bryobacteraceae bacterium]